MMGRFSFVRGVHPPERKGLSASSPVRRIEVEAGQEMVVPMSQHLGAVCEPTVEPKGEVTVGTSSLEPVMEGELDLATSEVATVAGGEQRIIGPQIHAGNVRLEASSELGWEVH